MMDELIEAMRCILFVVSEKDHPGLVQQARKALFAAESELPIATVLGCDPYDERDGIRLSIEDWENLNSLLKGDRLYLRSWRPKPETPNAELWGAPPIGGASHTNDVLGAAVPPAPTFNGDRDEH